LKCCCGWKLWTTTTGTEQFANIQADDFVRSSAEPFEIGAIGERNAAERRLRPARFPAAKLLDEFDFAARPSVSKPLLLKPVKGESLDRREKIPLVGLFGTGRSHLATALDMGAHSKPGTVSASRSF